MSKTIKEKLKVLINENSVYGRSNTKIQKDLKVILLTSSSDSEVIKVNSDVYLTSIESTESSLKEILYRFVGYHDIRKRLLPLQTSK